ncbi:serine/threonine protein kinase [Wenzhouxiangella sp. AB-CW3]|uniref:serine/threonine protein kinase n=1 Tax=Wenzhouxiangella sp. AB-CW3 TaxID=2771012 RepID=UPI00168ADB7E|nr:serine/threonine-protein kinase [Wenzhouxiangella sp. AB-CW3]QOC22185.1 serine/threonine protein kinase [Wenzhouxiangella sp. AB-CW3]
MNDWNTLQNWFDKLVALPENARRGALEALRRDDPALATELEDLLAVDSSTSTQIGWRVRRAATSLPFPGELESGDQIGAWRVKQRIGRGGMGIVYQVERVEGDFEQIAALKLVATAGDPALGDYFVRERQIMARLNHANIAGLLDGGVLEDGRPWLVMEFIEGLPINTWCDTQRLGIRQRLALFLRALDAVQFAHRSLVLHKDLKFSNLLVTDDGQPKLLDFGTASLMEDETSDDNQTRLLALTPEFSSPERIQGAPLTTASDIYSLGVMLYHLLAGCLPLDARTSSPAELERMVCEQEPLPPSRQIDGKNNEVASARSTTPRSLQQQLKGDLDAIVLTCLRKEPERRYATAQALAADIRAFLDDEPVSARKDAVGYRIGKFIRRRRWPLGSGIALVLAVGFGLNASLTSYLEAEQRRLELEHVAQFQNELLLTLDPADMGATVMGWLEDELGQHELGADGDLPAKLRETLDLADLGRTLIDRALLGTALERIGEHFVDMPMIGSEMARSVASNYHQLQLIDQALDALKLAERMARIDPEGEGEALQLRALRLSHQRQVGRLEEAESGLKELAAKLDADPDLADELVRGIVFKGLGDIAAQRGALPRALNDYQRSLNYRRAGGHASAARIVLQDIANTQARLGRVHDALNTLEQLEDEWTRAESADHPRAVSARLSKASALSDLGQLDEAEAIQREVLALRTRMHGRNDQRTLVVLNNLGLTLNRKGKPDRGMEKIRQAFDLRMNAYGPTDPWTINSAVRLASESLDEGEPENALDIADKILASNNPADSGSLVLLSLIALVAETEINREVDRERQADVLAHLDTLELGWQNELLADKLLARLDELKGEPGQARDRLQQAQQQLDDFVDPDHFIMRDLLNRLSRLESSST